jgi:hypothetical protein
VEKDYKGKRVIQPLGDGMQKKELHGDWMMPTFGWKKLKVDAGFGIEDNLGTWVAV